MKAMKTAVMATSAMRALRDRIAVSYCITACSRGRFDRDLTAADRLAPDVATPGIDFG
jgi:hypothetical protein